MKSFFNIEDQVFVKICILNAIATLILMFLVNRYEGSILGNIVVDLVVFPALLALPPLILVNMATAPQWTKNTAKLVSVLWLIVLCVVVPFSYYLQ